MSHLSLSGTGGVAAAPLRLRLLRGAVGLPVRGGADGF